MNSVSRPTASRVSRCAPSSARAADVVTTGCNGFRYDLYNRARTLCESSDSTESHEGAHSALYPDCTAPPRSPGPAGLPAAPDPDHDRVSRRERGGERRDAPAEGVGGASRHRYRFHVCVVFRTVAARGPLRTQPTNDYSRDRVPDGALTPAYHFGVARAAFRARPDL